MKQGSVLVAAVLLLAGACGNGGRATQSTSADPPGARPAPQPAIDRAEQCVSTDPGWRPISVHRAVNCPEGTPVTVQGVLIHAADGSAKLCDVVNPTHDQCVGDGLTVDGAAAQPVLASSVFEVVLSGVVSGRVLTGAARSNVLDPAPPEVKVFSRPSTPQHWE